jgi:hypothetical protein
MMLVLKSIAESPFLESVEDVAVNSETAPFHTTSGPYS